MSVKLLTERHLEFLSLKRGYKGSSESTNVKIPLCWKSHVTAHLWLSEPSVMSVSTSRVVSCCEIADLLALFYLMFSWAFVTFPCGVLGQVWYLIVLIPGLEVFKTGVQSQTQNKAQ